MLLAIKPTQFFSRKTHESPQRFFGISISSSRKLAPFRNFSEQYFGLESMVPSIG